MVDAYKIGVSIALTNGVSAALAVIQKDVLGLNHAVGLTTAGFNRLKLAVAGAAGLTIGGAMLGGLMELSKHGEKYVHQLEQMKLAGFSLAEQQDAIFAANRVSSQVLTTGPAGNLEAIRELRMALNSAGANPAAATREAIEYLGAVQKAKSVMVSAMGQEHGADVFEMVKALEQIGATQNVHRFETLLDGMVRASVSSGGKLNSRDFFQTLKYTRGAGRYYSDEFLQFYLPTLMQEMKTGGGGGQGGGAGNPLASLYQVLAGGAIGNKAAQEWLKMGLLDPSKIIQTRTGSIKGVKPGGVVGADIGIQNPYFWVRDVLIPRLRAHGLSEGSTKEAEELARMFPNRVAQQMINLLSQVRRMEGDRHLIDGAMHMDAAYAEAIRHDPVLTKLALKSQWERVQADLGKHITPVVNEAIFRLAQGLAKLGEVIERHPVATKWILAFIAGLGAFLVVAGSIALAVAALAALGSAAWAGPIVAAIMAFGAAIGYVASLVDWHSFGEWARRLMQGAREWAATSAHWVGEIVRSLRADVLSLWAGVTESLIAFKNRLIGWVHDLISTIMGVFSRPISPPAGTPGAPGTPPPAYDPGMTPTAFRPHGQAQPHPMQLPQLPALRTPRLQSASYEMQSIPGLLPASYQAASITMPMPPESSRQPIQVRTQVNLDGRTIARIVTDHQADQMARPPASATRFDPAMTPAFQPLRA